MTFRAFLLILVLVCVGACDDGHVASSKSRYSCPGNLWLDVTFSGGKTVKINMEGKVFTLHRVQSSSGTRYESDDGQLFWSMGKDAHFSERPGSTPISCQRR